jgi:hypothetical protein
MENFLVGTERPEQTIAEDTLTLVASTIDPAGPWRTLEQPDASEDGGARQIGADAHCS